MTGELAPAIPAATLVLMRECGSAAPELLMIERAGTMAFAAGALVFPGGRIDPGDAALAANAAVVGESPPEDAAARIAAIRETIEEVGIAIGIRPAPGPSAIAALRAALAEGGDFGALLAAGGWRLDLDALTAFARWRPNFKETRLFDTRFYLAAAPVDATPAADGGESIHALWIGAADALAGALDGRFRVIFPTRRNLERLALFDGIDTAIAHAARFTVEMVTPWVEDRGGTQYLCIRDDQGYPVTAVPLADELRG
ncbi:NUDIX hydrolase [Edaphosphingomonas haloaromaticamans]|uniref:NUDIX domain protein n=1 Tax=Edaphosphingomonas haloaromaticamans TaxID=653954 RepID=A0A1S1H7Q1_9SPHN|nr:NUDIX hydrolase [Sphingomonas haloaromaticamans]OHT18168.1 NUDIX domain protein [Sphingomonas haloaromaticamans]